MCNNMEIRGLGSAVLEFMSPISISSNLQAGNFEIIPFLANFSILANTPTPSRMVFNLK